MSATPIQRLAKALCAVTSNGKPFEVAEFARRFAVDGRAARAAVRGMDVTAAHYLHLCAAVGIDPMTGNECTPRPLQDIDWNRVGIKIKLVLIGSPGDKPLTMRAAAKQWKIPLVVLGRMKAANVAGLGNFLALCAALNCHPHEFLKSVPLNVSQKHVPEHIETTRVVE